MRIERRLAQAAGQPLTGRRVVVFGAGPLGLFAALGLATNGADVVLYARDHLLSSTGFRHAAGLIEPVATEDERATRWFDEGVKLFSDAVDDEAWGVVRRAVLFLSDHAEDAYQPWMDAVPNQPASDEDLIGRRRFGTWFKSLVVQPDIAQQAIKRELASLGVDAANFLKKEPVRSVAHAATITKAEGADAFVLALGLGLAELEDIDEFVDRRAGLSAGIGLTIRGPIAGFGDLDHVLMDADDLGYLIPQRTQVVCGGTNIVTAFDDTELWAYRSRDADIRELHEEWTKQVLTRVERLWPHAPEAVRSGEIRVGARPLRHEVLTAFADHDGVPGLILGGAGGSGWTFAVGIANDAVAFLAGRFGDADPGPLRIAVD